ncbi:MAG TPA: hypothetical protein VEI97_19330 [bacterium]|nr:hypothetical protein [bacterium]
MRILLLLLCALVLALPAVACAKGGGAAGTAQAANTDPSGLPIVSWENAMSMVGKEAVVEGTVVATKEIKSAIFINFHSDYKHTFSIYVPINSKGALVGGIPGFPQSLEGKKIRVKGMVEHFTRDGNDKPEIKVHSPDQITIL